MKKVTMSAVPREKVGMTGGLFTGTQVWRQPIFEPEDSNNYNFGIVAFDAGSRNKFHKHSGDQILLITEGTGKVVSDDESFTVTEGDVVMIPAGENHWHGAPDAHPWPTSPSPLRGVRRSRQRPNKPGLRDSSRVLDPDTSGFSTLLESPASHLCRSDLHHHMDTVCPSHALELVGILFEQKTFAGLVLPTLAEDLYITLHADSAQLAPVVKVVVNNERNLWPAFQVAYLP